MDKIQIMIPGLIILVLGFAIFSWTLPTYHVLVLFGIVASVLIGCILYVRRLPDITPNDISQKESMK